MKANTATDTGNTPAPPRVVRVLSATSCVLLGIAVVLVAGQFLPVGQGPGSPGWWWATTGFLAWLTLPPIGLFLAIPGLRQPRSRWAVLGLTGHAVLLIILWIVMTFFFSFVF